MTIKFNTIRYIELLQKNQSLEKKNSSLREEEKIKYFELLSYKIILSSQIIYNNRHNYISLIEKYLINEINSFELKLKFLQMEREDSNIKDDLENNFEQLSNVLIASESSEFSELIEDIYSSCEVLKCFGEPEEDFGLNELEFRAIIEKTFLQMKKYSDK